MSKIVISYIKDEVDRELQYAVQFSHKRGKELAAAAKEVDKVDGWIKVAEYEYDDRKELLDNLENAWMILQNGVVTDSWTLSPPDGLTPLVEPHHKNGRDYGHRSSMTGDKYTYEGKHYIVAPAGFEELPA